MALEMLEALWEVFVLRESARRTMLSWEDSKISKILQDLF